MQDADIGAAQRLPIADGRTTARRVGRVVATHPWLASATLLSLLAVSAAGLAVPWILGHMVDLVSGPNPLPALGRATIVLLILACVTAALGALANILVARIGQWTLATLREEVFDAAVRLPAETLEQAGSGDLVSRVSRDVDAANEAASGILPTFISALFTIALTLVGLGAIDLRFAAAVLICVPVQWFALRRFLRASGPLYRDLRIAESDRGQQLLEATAGADTVRALGHSGRRLAMIGDSSTHAIGFSLHAVLLRSRFFGLLNIAELLGLGAILATGFLLVRGDAVTVGAATAAALFFHRLFGPIGALLANVDELQKAGAGLARLVGLIALEPQPPADPPGTDPEQGLVLRGVDAGYRRGHEVISGFDLDLEPGGHIALVGASGAGKTTLARIIAGSLAPLAGTAGWGGGGAPVLGTTAVLISQEVHLFSGTLAQNLRMAAPDATDAELDAVVAAGGAGWIRSLPEGLDTLVGAGGQTLTGDRAQHVALLRAMLTRAPLVVLDEATAEAGSTSSRVLEHAAEELIRGRTAVVVAHRLTQAAKADRILVMERGRVIESGSHVELLARHGAYARLWAAWEQRG